MSQLDDAALVALARTGDRRAEEAIYRRYVRYVGAIALHICGRQQESEDIVQDVFTLALPGLGQLRDPAALRGWLARLTVSRCSRNLRRRRILRFVGLDEGDDDAPLHRLGAPDLAPEARLELQRISEILQTCDDDARIAWVLHRVEGETLEAAAAICGCSLATVKRRIATVSARLAKELGLETPS